MCEFTMYVMQKKEQKIELNGKELSIFSSNLTVF